ncbi:MAG: TolC family protein [Rhodospirillaceae bacterium]
MAGVSGRAAIILGAVVAGLGLAGPALAAGPAPGSSLEELLQVVHRMNPELAAATLEAEAAAARAEAAGRLPDPKFALKYDEWPRASPGYAPSISRFGTMRYELSQEIPLGGKRELRREQALAEHRQSQGQRQAAALDLAARVKIVYAEYHQALKAIEQLGALRGLVGRTGQSALARYGQSLGSQMEPLQADLERRELEGELVRMGLERQLAQVRLNALLNRPAGAPLSTTPRLRPLPPAARLEPAALLERARVANPGLQTQQARIDAADRGRDLADRSWYPDLGVGVGVVQKSSGVDSYEALIELNIPLQWGLRRAQQAEATAMASAARSRLTQAERQLESDLTEAVYRLRAALEREKILRSGLVPQANSVLRSAAKAYELGQGEFPAVLEAGRRLRTIQLDQLRLQLEQQVRLAEIERLIGGDL